MHKSSFGPKFDVIISHALEKIEKISIQPALTHIQESKWFDFENGREERCRANMPELPERQTYVPTLNKKSKRW